MDYSNQATEFSGGIQELSFDEIEYVNGGVWLIVAAVVVGVTLVAIGWEAAHQRANAAE